MAHTSAAIVISLCFGALAFTSKFTEGGQIGVCYGTVANDLPSPEKVVSLLQSNNIDKVRLYNPNPSALEALKSTQIEIIVGVANEDLQKIGSDSSEATSWVKNNVLKHSPANIKLISVGNEISSQKDNLPYLLAAMKAIQNAITAARLQGQIKVSTTHASDVLSTSYPPSSGTFADDISEAAPSNETSTSTSSTSTAHMSAHVSTAHNISTAHIPYCISASLAIGYCYGYYYNAYQM